MDKDALIAKLLNQQRVLADFGSFAFRARDLRLILERAAQSCAECMEARFCKISRFRREDNDFIIVGAYGWDDDDLINRASPADTTNPVGRAFRTTQPILSDNMLTDEDYNLPDYYISHKVVSCVTVLIPGENGQRPYYGVLEIDDIVARTYDEQDISFLTGFANVLAEAVGTSHRIAGLQAALEEKEVLSRELHHRVRNNLHLIYSMLNMEAESQPEATESFRTVASRVQALATVYDHLLGTGLARMIAFDQYLEKLCATLRTFQPGKVELTNRPPPTSVMVDLDTATAMGIAITELITNSYKHAFPTGEGKIEITLEYKSGMPVLKVADNGVGMDVSQPTKRHGLGLVRRLVEQVNASIQVQRTEQGTLCEIVLPQHQAAA
jgi:two-component sensor histidine kinase